MIDGVVVTVLQQVPDERGNLMKMLRADSPQFTSFGEVYFSLVNPGMIKAWRRHLRVTQRFAVPIGQIRLVIHDPRPGSPSAQRTEVLAIGASNYCLVEVPPLVWYGFESLSPIPSLIANCTDAPYDPNEVERLPHDDSAIPHRWGA